MERWIRQRVQLADEWCGWIGQGFWVLLQLKSHPGLLFFAMTPSSWTRVVSGQAVRVGGSGSSLCGLCCDANDPPMRPEEMRSGAMVDLPSPETMNYALGSRFQAPPPPPSRPAEAMVHKMGCVVGCRGLSVAALFMSELLSWSWSSYLPLGLGGYSWWRALLLLLRKSRFSPKDRTQNRCVLIPKEKKTLPMLLPRFRGRHRRIDRKWSEQSAFRRDSGPTIHVLRHLRHRRCSLLPGFFASSLASALLLALALA